MLTTAAAPTPWEPTELLLLLSRRSVCSGSSPPGVAPHSCTELFSWSPTTNVWPWGSHCRLPALCRGKGWNCQTLVRGAAVLQTST